MPEQERHVQVMLAEAAAFIERLATDLGLGEEPSGFLVALEEAAPDE